MNASVMFDICNIFLFIFNKTIILLGRLDNFVVWSVDKKRKTVVMENEQSYRARGLGLDKNVRWAYGLG